MSASEHSHSQHIHFLDQGQAALPLIAEHIIGNTPACPDLTGVTIIVADSRLMPGLRRALLEAALAQNHPALLGPDIVTLDHWLEKFIPQEINVCDDQVRLLILVEALLGSPGLLKEANPWALADSLLTLFDELTLNKIELAEDLDEFNRQLSEWYETGQQHFSGLQQEAALIHTLWHAWHEQLQAQGYTDPVAAQLLAMNNSLDAEHTQLHLVGIEPDYSSQQDWLRKLLNKNHVDLWLHGVANRQAGECRIDDHLYRIQQHLAIELDPVESENEYQQAMSAIFAREPQFAERARSFAEQHPQSPLTDRIGIFAAHNAEQQIHAIDTQIRRWLLDGKQRIAVVTENRMLARRLRALLERADIQLQDVAGWTLATTRAAASIESLLLCIEEDFDKDALLDLLKSGLVFPQQDPDKLKRLVYRLEHDIIQHEKISNSLLRFRHAIVNRRERLQEIWSFSPGDIIELLNHIETATRPLRKLHGKKNKIREFMLALHETLEQLGMNETLQQDPAGQIILQLLDEMTQASDQHALQVRWSHFRTWLGRNFERRYFQPQSNGSNVYLYNLSQAGFQNFDGLIIAGLEQDSIPGTPAAQHFFNNQVRNQLGLPGVEQFREKRLQLFSNLLHSSDSILLTCRSDQDGEPVIASPWLSAIQQFHELAWQNKLLADELLQLLRQQSTDVIRCDTREVPARQQRPQTSLSAEMIPQSISASSYNRLMKCPYQFFASHCLKLKPPEEIQQALSKQEYGERVHLCLQCFHSDVPNRPGPFTEKLTEQNRAQAIELMQQIASNVFEDDLQENYIHNGWFHQWLQVVPEYINWQIRHSTNAQVVATEQMLERQVNNRLTLKGRIDRIDRTESVYQVIDYKTGATPTKKDILAGEEVQLPFYRLLAEPEQMSIESTSYLVVGSAKDFTEKFRISGEELSGLADNVLTRLDEMIGQIEQGHELPAWESSKACQHCVMVTLCRRGSWSE
jgi:ATP-dependent helicase/nuclease subunit B